MPPTDYNRNSQTATTTNSLDRLCKLMEEMNSEIREIRNTVTNIEKKQTFLETSVLNIRTTTNRLQQQQETIQSEIEELKSYSRRQNIRIFGWDGKGAKNEEECKTNFITFAKDYLKLHLEAAEINRAHWIGAGSKKAMIIQFLTWSSKMKVMTNLKNLRTTAPTENISINDDLTKAENEAKKANLPLYKKLKAEAGPGDRIQLRRGSIFVNGRPYLRQGVTKHFEPQQPSGNAYNTNIIQGNTSHHVTDSTPYQLPQGQQFHVNIPLREQQPNYHMPPYQTGPG